MVLANVDIHLEQRVGVLVQSTFCRKGAQRDREVADTAAFLGDAAARAKRGFHFLVLQPLAGTGHDEAETG